MINWIDPENEMPEKNLYSFPIELTNSKGEKLIVSGKFDDATTKWLDDDGYELECGGWTVTGWMPLPEPRQPKRYVRWHNVVNSKDNDIAELAAENKRLREELDKERDKAHELGAPTYAELLSEISDLTSDNKRLRKALEKIACRHVTVEPLWWQNEARRALEGGE